MKTLDIAQYEKTYEELESMSDEQLKSLIDSASNALETHNCEVEKSFKSLFTDLAKEYLSERYNVIVRKDDSYGSFIHIVFCKKDEDNSSCQDYDCHISIAYSYNHTPRRYGRFINEIQSFEKENLIISSDMLDSRGYSLTESDDAQEIVVAILFAFQQKPELKKTVTDMYKMAFENVDELIGSIRYFRSICADRNAKKRDEEARIKFIDTQNAYVEEIRKAKSTYVRIQISFDDDDRNIDIFTYRGKKCRICPNSTTGDFYTSEFSDEEPYNNGLYVQKWVPVNLIKDAEGKKSMFGKTRR